MSDRASDKMPEYMLGVASNTYWVLSLWAVPSYTPGSAHVPHTFKKEP